MLENMLWSETSYIIEGEAILPELIHEILKKHPNNIKICFVGYSNMDVKEKVKDVYEYSNEKNDWLTNESNDYVENHISNMVDYSKKIEKACKQYDVKYFDTSKNFSQVLDNVIKYLLEKE
jgi:2-phosphoglycerate kinase